MAGKPASASVGLGARPRAGGEPTGYARQILDAVDAIPPGRVMTYGDVAEYVGRGSGRVVGNVLHHHGHEVSWWRVLLASGEPNPANPVEAARRLRAEGVPFRRGGGRVDLAACRWDGQPV